MQESSASKRNADRWEMPSEEEISDTVQELDLDDDTPPMDEDGRIIEVPELKELVDSQSEAIKSTLVRLEIMADETRAATFALMLKNGTPKSVIKLRKGRGKNPDGSPVMFSYIPTWYVKRVLNTFFALQWDFKILPMNDGEAFHMAARQVMVRGQLTIRDVNGKDRIVKEDFGKKDISYTRDEMTKKPTTTPVDLGNDLKAARSDALKRCATDLGIGLDLYMNEG